MNIIQFYKIYLVGYTQFFNKMQKKKKSYYFYTHATKCTRNLSGIIILFDNERRLTM